MLEAWACSLPAIVTESCGISDLVKSSRTGLVVPYDRHLLASAIVELLANEALRKELGNTARKLVDERFTLSKVCDRLEKVYAEVTRRDVHERS